MDKITFWLGSLVTYLLYDACLLWFGVQAPFSFIGFQGNTVKEDTEKFYLWGKCQQNEDTYPTVISNKPIPYITSTLAQPLDG